MGAGLSSSRRQTRQGGSHWVPAASPQPTTAATFFKPRHACPRTAPPSAGTVSCPTCHGNPKVRRLTPDFGKAFDLGPRWDERVAARMGQWFWGAESRPVDKRKLFLEYPSGMSTVGGRAGGRVGGPELQGESGWQTSVRAHRAPCLLARWSPRSVLLVLDTPFPLLFCVPAAGAARQQPHRAACLLHYASQPAVAPVLSV